MTKIGVYPGTFDPMTNGHLNIIQRSLKIVDKLIIGVADNLNKKPILTFEERKDIIVKDIDLLNLGIKEIEIHSVTGLLTEFAK
ncbi:MAG: adenylyltransferase/cytidyltransferase family protein, partial [Pelagibacteraceae bacterium]|nr:adenylyltransferase/cytidyltransferase family protein [Pelagibacteraceae bacterium]